MKPQPELFPYGTPEIRREAYRKALEILSVCKEKNMPFVISQTLLSIIKEDLTINKKLKKHIKPNLIFLLFPELYDAFIHYSKEPKWAHNFKESSQHETYYFEYGFKKLILNYAITFS